VARSSATPAAALTRELIERVDSDGTLLERSTETQLSVRGPRAHRVPGDTARMKLSLALLLVLATRAHAGDSTAGKAKSIACQACHVAGNAPHLVGQREPYLVEQLTAFKAGDRKNDFMNPIAKQLSETDIANLAAYWSAQATGSDATASAAVTAIKQPRMTFPKDFPKGFTAYRSETDAAHHTMTKSYANGPALTAAKAGKPMPDGSAVIVVSYAVDASGAAGKPTSYSGMEARAGWGKDIPELLQNGDWSYNLWTADRAAKPDVNQAVCLACHKPAAASSYVFTYDQIKTAK